MNDDPINLSINNKHLTSIDNQSVQHQLPKKYLTLEDVFNLYPLPKNDIKFVSIYGIIQSFDAIKGILTLMDETRKNFTIHANLLSNKSGSLPRRTGDIIRIQQLCLYSDFTRRCNSVDNVVMFESFRDNRFKPVYVAENPKFNNFDKKRVEELIKYNVHQILEAKIRPTRQQYFNLVDAAFQVLCTLKYENRIIIACWNGKPFDEYPCMQLIKVQQIIDTLNSLTKHVYGEEFIKKIYNEYKIVFISVYGVHRTVAETLRPLDIIVVYNLLIKYDKYYYGKHSYHIYDGLIFGRCIRTADDNSEIAILLRKQIEKSCILDELIEYENYQFDQSMSQIIEINESDQENLDMTSKRRKIMKNSQGSISFFLSDTLDESTLNNEIHKVPCPHSQYNVVERAIIHRHFYSNQDRQLFGAVRLKSFTDISNNKCNVENKFFQINAKFHSFIFDKQINLFESMKTLRKYATVVQCTDGDCQYHDTFEAYLAKSSKSYQEIDGKLVYINENGMENLNRLRCPSCGLQYCILCLDFTLILQDYDKVLLLAEFTGIDANQFFDCTTIDLCSAKSTLLEKIPAVFKHMFHITNDQTECSQQLTWTLIVNGDRRDQREFQIVDVSLLTKSVSCGIITNH